MQPNGPAHPIPLSAPLAVTALESYLPPVAPATRSWSTPPTIPVPAASSGSHQTAALLHSYAVEIEDIGQAQNLCDAVSQVEMGVV